MLGQFPGSISRLDELGDFVAELGVVGGCLPFTLNFFQRGVFYPQDG